MTESRLRVAIVATHPIQYYAPWYRALARDVDLHVFFAHRQTATGQARAGFDVAFEWDVPLLDGYAHTFLKNVARRPDVESFWGCDTPEIAAIIARGAFDAVIVHGWSTWSYWQAMRASWRTGTPLFVRGDSNLGTPRAWWWRALKTPLFRAFIPRFDGYFIVGRRSREYLLHYGARPERCFDAPHAVDNAFFRTRADEASADRVAIRREFGLPVDAVVALFVSRFVPGKAPNVFVAAVAQSARRGVAGLMVGDGPLRAETEAWVSAQDAPVRFAGFMNQGRIAGAYAAADVLVVPSESETWSLVVNEAMACGLPAFVTDNVGCAHNLVVPNQTGQVFPVGDAAALSARLDEFAADPALRARLSAGALARVEQFDVAVAAAGTVRAIQTVIAARQSSGRQSVTSPVPKRVASGGIRRG